MRSPISTGRRCFFLDFFLERRAEDCTKCELNCNSSSGSYPVTNCLKSTGWINKQFDMELLSLITLTCCRKSCGLDGSIRPKIVNPSRFFFSECCHSRCVYCITRVMSWGDGHAFAWIDICVDSGLRGKRNKLLPQTPALKIYAQETEFLAWLQWLHLFSVGL